jgi:2-dehydro-3-deoxygluconokinase
MMELRKRGVGVDKIVYGGDRLGIYFLETVPFLEEVK